MRIFKLDFLTWNQFFSNKILGIYFYNIEISTKKIQNQVQIKKKSEKDKNIIFLIYSLSKQVKRAISI